MHTQQTPSAMNKNYFKTTLRYLWKNTVFSLINITGLATGIYVCFFALLYVHFELNRNRFIALVTISFQSVKAAIANPVRNLKAE
jgi:hypothetical protein